MTTIEERSEYLKNPYLGKPLYGDFGPFYKTIAVCSVFCAIIFILNIVIGCCSKHKQYWQDRHTGKKKKNLHLRLIETASKINEDIFPCFDHQLLK